jgi:hypothetical protein
MSAISMMNQTITVYQRSSYDGEGREVVGNGTTVRARVQPKTKNVFSQNSQLLTVEIVAYVPPDTSIVVDDRVGYGSQFYKVHTAYPTPNGDGNVEFIKVELLKWQT